MILKSFYERHVLHTGGILGLPGEGPVAMGSVYMNRNNIIKQEYIINSLHGWIMMRAAKIKWRSDGSEIDG